MAAPAYYLASHGSLNISVQAFALICLGVIASTTIVSTAVLYSLAVKPLLRANGILQDLCSRVTQDVPENSHADEVGQLEGGLRCMAGQWEKNRLRLEEVNREELRKMESLATLGEMAFSVAHDIKNPLAGISGAIQVFAEEFPEGDQRGDIVREVLSEIARLDHTVKDLQTFARPPVAHPMPALVGDILERAVREVSENAKKMRVDVNISECPENLELNVDTEQMHEALQNIMDFSIKNMPEGGTLTLYARMGTESGIAEIVLKDTSAVLRGESMEALFKPFKSSRMSHRGLSMAISKAHVERHRGSITVESSPGAGTTFRIALPVYKKNA